MDNVTEKVARAARYLDVIKPGWADKVNLNVFTMSSGDLCVCGQNGLGWQATARAYEEVTGVNYGRELFANYDAEWRVEIEARKTPLPELLVFGSREYVMIESDSEITFDGEFVRVADRDGDWVTINLNTLRAGLDR